MNKVKIKGSYKETLNFLQENLNPEDLKGFKYLKPLQKIQERALKESLGKPYRDPICDYIIKHKLVGRVRDNGIIDALTYSYGDLSRFIETNYTDKFLEAYGTDVIIPEFVHFSPLEDIKAQLIEYKRMEAEEKSHNFFRDSKGIERFSIITFKTLLEDYYSGFEYVEGDNTPSLKKQLTSQNIAFKEDDLKTWGEVKAWFENYYTGKPNFHKGYHYRTLIYDYFDDKIEDISKKWVFCGSCHAERKTGSDTPKILDALDYKMLKFYCLDEEYNLIPSTRIYYYQEGKDIAFSGTYTNFGNGEMARSGYSFTKAIMCFIFDKKFEDLKEIKGMDINTSELEDVGIRFYANTSQDSKYKTFGTAEILSGIHIDAGDAYHILNSK
jgi:hypothetical protein